MRAMKGKVLLLLCVLGGCAPAPIASNAAGGLVRIRGSINGQAKAMLVADAECHKYGKVARYGSTNDLRGTVKYDCVAP